MGGKWGGSDDILRSWVPVRGSHDNPHKQYQEVKEETRDGEETTCAKEIVDKNKII